MGKGSVIESGVSTNKMGKCKNEGMEIEDRAGGLDVVAINGLDIFIRGLGGVGGLRDTIKSMEISIVATKNLDVSTRGLRGITKNVIIIIEK